MKSSLLIRNENSIIPEIKPVRFGLKISEVIKVSFLSLFFIGLCGNALAAGNAAETLFIHALRVFERSLAGDDSVTNVALNEFKILSMTYPNNPLFLAYQGACYTLVGRDAWMPWNKTSYVKKGLDNIDKALRMLKMEHDRGTMRSVPVSVETRLVAASTFSEVPKSFNHFEKAKGVLKNIFQSIAFNKTPKPLQAQVYLQAAKIARMENKRREEIKWLRQILDIEPQGESAKAARERLRELN